MIYLPSFYLQVLPLQSQTQIERNTTQHFTAHLLIIYPQFYNWIDWLLWSLRTDSVPSLFLKSVLHLFLCVWLWHSYLWFMIYLYLLETLVSISRCHRSSLQRNDWSNKLRRLSLHQWRNGFCTDQASKVLRFQIHCNCNTKSLCHYNQLFLYNLSLICL